MPVNTESRKWPFYTHGTLWQHVKAHVSSFIEVTLKVRSYDTAIALAVPIYRLFSAASHRSFTAFQVKMNLTFMRHSSAALQFLCRTVRCGNATQLRCSMNGPLLRASLWKEDALFWGTHKILTPTFQNIQWSVSAVVIHIVSNIGNDRFIFVSVLVIGWSCHWT